MWPAASVFALGIAISRSNRPPVDTGPKLNVHKTFLCTFNLQPVSTGPEVLNIRAALKIAFLHLCAPWKHQGCSNRHPNIFVIWVQSFFIVCFCSCGISRTVNLRLSATPLVWGWHLFYVNTIFFTWKPCFLILKVTKFTAFTPNINILVIFILQKQPPEVFCKERVQHRCFPVKFTKLLRTPILKNIYKRLLLILIKWLTGFIGFFKWKVGLGLLAKVLG